MTIKQAKEFMKIERECVLRQDTPECGREEYGCEYCDLVQDGKDVVAAYDKVIEALEEMEEA